MFAPLDALLNGCATLVVAGVAVIVGIFPLSVGWAEVLFVGSVIALVRHLSRREGRRPSAGGAGETREGDRPWPRKDPMR